MNENEVIKPNYSHTKYFDFPLKKYRRIPLPTYNNLQSEYNQRYQQYHQRPQQPYFLNYQQPELAYQQPNYQNFRPHTLNHDNHPYAGQFLYNQPGNNYFYPEDQTNYKQQGNGNTNEPIFGNFLNSFGNNDHQGLSGSGGSPISNIFNNLQNGVGGNFGGQLGKALEDISKNDDYQCVPKLLCQMVGNPRSQNSLPSFINAPTLTA